MNMNTEKQIEFDKVKEIWAGYAVTEYAKDKKIWINHKRVKLHVKAEQLYPEDYDFSIIFDSVETRKKRHDMDRKFTQETIMYSDD